MRTKASFAGHPAHVMLVHFPIGLLTSGFLFDVAARALRRPELSTVGGYLIFVGLVSGVVAALPGIVDFAASVPKGTGVATRTVRHAVVSVLALVVFGGAWMLRGGVQVEPTSVVLVMEAIGTVLLSLAGYFGGSLVLEDHIGVSDSS